ncbi:transglutaminase N-terminal domain-containing protein, partial [Escherichia fergusonii]|uniref:transglutaminase N-terminal domain-containing protein n=1 Tax=Escherichia fergusonii TaxID=564 RepID=UPI001CBFC30D
HCVAHELVIDPAPADSSTSRDTYGNISSYFHVTEPHRALTIVSDSIVDVAPQASGIYSTGPALQPWENARPNGA